MTIIGSNVLEKTGTKIVKRVAKPISCSYLSGAGKDFLETTIEYGAKSPMREKYGITKLKKYSLGDRIVKYFTKENGNGFSFEQNKKGEILDYSDSLVPFIDSNATKTLKNILNALNFAKK